MRVASYLGALVLGFGVTTSVSAAKFQTANFEVTADDLQVAQEIGQEAEKYRAALSRHWLNRTLDDWNFSCRIEVQSEETGGTGWTTYRFRGENVTRVDIRLQGAPERLLEYVLPHELSHAVLVIAMGKPMPRWADEGAAMLSESPSQKLRQQLVVEQLVRSGDAISFRKFLEMVDYPSEKEQLHAFYAQSLTLCEFLIAEGGRSRYLEFAQEGHSQGWDQAIQRHYQMENRDALEAAWRQWVLRRAEARKTKASHLIVESR